MRVLLESRSGKTLGYFEIPRYRKQFIESILKNLVAINKKNDTNTCLVTLNTISWNFNKDDMFDIIWNFLYESYQLQSMINEIQKQQENIKVKKK